MTILTATRWPSNAEMIEDVARLGYLDGKILDCSFGYGTFWANWTPDDFVACDLDPEKSPCGYSVDFRDMPFTDKSFDVVVFDPPYKLNGTPTDDVDERYGVHVKASIKERHQLIFDGLHECMRVSRKRVLLKCQDQVASGHKWWQTIMFTQYAMTEGMKLIDRFDMLGTPRPQRSQKHSHSNYSTLLVFSR